MSNHTPAATPTNSIVLANHLIETGHDPAAVAELRTPDEQGTWANLIHLHNTIQLATIVDSQAAPETQGTVSQLHPAAVFPEAAAA
jgi:hypothetical protein